MEQHSFNLLEPLPGLTKEQKEEHHNNLMNVYQDHMDEMDNVDNTPEPATGNDDKVVVVQTTTSNWRKFLLGK